MNNRGAGAGNDQQQSDWSQRQKLVVERRQQIDEARRQRVQSAMPAAGRPTVPAKPSHLSQRQSMAPTNSNIFFQSSFPSNNHHQQHQAPNNHHNHQSSNNAHHHHQQSSSLVSHNSPSSAAAAAVAFGSTRPRNIDLTRPLVTPISTNPLGLNTVHEPVAGAAVPSRTKSFAGYTPSGGARPKSELFPASYGTDEQATAAQVQNEPIVHSNSSQSLVQTSTAAPSQVAANTAAAGQATAGVPYRAARRHDPELVPALKKYIFRDYCMPSSASANSFTLGSGGGAGGSSMRKENPMTHSMYATRGVSTRPATSSNLNASTKTKKSFSMNRLDQLAQPRKRFEPKANGPNTSTPTTFRSPTVSGGSNVRSSAASASSDHHSPRATSVTKATPSASTPTSGGAVVKKKTRPMSSIEPLQSPIVATPSAPLAPVAPARAATPTIAEQQEAAEPGAEATTESAAAAGPVDPDQKLEDYKRALAEKKALYRKQMEEQKALQQLAESGSGNVVVKPVMSRARIMKPKEEDLARHQHDSSSSSSSSSSSDADSDAEEEKGKKDVEPNAPQTIAQEKVQEKPSNDDKGPAEVPVENGQVTEELISTAADAAADVPSPSHTGESSGTPTLTNSTTLMTSSCDPSMLAAALNQEASSGASAAAVSSPVAVTKTQAELTAEELERSSRKKRLEEIMNRTVRKSASKTNAEQSSSRVHHHHHHRNHSSGSAASASEANSLNSQQETSSTSSASLDPPKSLEAELAAHQQSSLDEQPQSYVVTTITSTPNIVSASAGSDTSLPESQPQEQKQQLLVDFGSFENVVQEQQVHQATKEVSATIVTNGNGNGGGVSNGYHHSLLDELSNVQQQQQQPTLTPTNGF